MISNTDSILLIYPTEHMLAKAYKDNLSVGMTGDEIFLSHETSLASWLHSPTGNKLDRFRWARRADPAVPHRCLYLSGPKRSLRQVMRPENTTARLDLEIGTSFMRIQDPAGRRDVILPCLGEKTSDVL